MTFLIILLFAKNIYSQDINKILNRIDSLKAIKTDYLNKVQQIDFLIKESEDKKIINEFEKFESFKYIVPSPPLIKIRDIENSSGKLLFEPKKGEVITLIDFNDINDYWLVSYNNTLGYVNEVLIKQSQAIDDFKKYLVVKRNIMYAQQAEENSKMLAQKAKEKEKLQVIKDEENKKLQVIKDEEDIKIKAQKAEEDRKFQAQKDLQVKAKLEKRKKDLISKYGTEAANKILAGKIWLGMTDAMARESWGLPEDINRTVGALGVHEQWIYPRNVYVYFENGILTTWQD